MCQHYDIYELSEMHNYYDILCLLYKPTAYLCIDRHFRLIIILYALIFFFREEGLRLVIVADLRMGTLWWQRIYRCLDDVIEEASDSEGADAADDRCDGGEVGAGADVIGDIAFEDAVFAGGASINDAGARFDHGIRN